MKTVAIIQARMGSTRLPGKVLKEVLGKPLLWHMVQRVLSARSIDEIVIATSDREQDKAIIALAGSIGIGSYAGSEGDVLDRYYNAALGYQADTIVRLTSDCPLIDPEWIDKVVEEYRGGQGRYDYVSLSGPFPDGLDTEVFSFRALETAWTEAILPSEREHVTPYIWKNSNLFSVGRVVYPEEHGHLRWTVDDERDFALVNSIYTRLYKSNPNFRTQDVLHLLEKEPELLKINADTVRNEGYLKSLDQDKTWSSAEKL